MTTVGRRCQPGSGLRPPQPGTPVPDRGPAERWLLRWKSLTPVLFGLSLVLTVPVPVPAADPADRTIFLGDCVVQTVDIKGKLHRVKGQLQSDPPIPFEYWELWAAGKTYYLDLRGKELLEVAETLNGRTVVVTGIP